MNTCLNPARLVCKHYSTLPGVMNMQERAEAAEMELVELRYLHEEMVEQTQKQALALQRTEEAVTHFEVGQGVEARGGSALPTCAFWSF